MLSHTYSGNTCFRYFYGPIWGPKWPNNFFSRFLCFSVLSITPIPWKLTWYFRDYFLRLKCYLFRTVFLVRNFYNSNLDKCHYTRTMSIHGRYKIRSHHPNCWFSPNRHSPQIYEHRKLNHIGSYIARMSEISIFKFRWSRRFQVPDFRGLVICGSHSGIRILWVRFLSGSTDKHNLAIVFIIKNERFDTKTPRCTRSIIVI